MPKERLTTKQKQLIKIMQNYDNKIHLIDGKLIVYNGEDEKVNVDNDTRESLERKGVIKPCQWILTEETKTPFQMPTFGD